MAPSGCQSVPGAPRSDRILPTPTKGLILRVIVELHARHAACCSALVHALLAALSVVALAGCEVAVDAPRSAAPACVAPGTHANAVGVGAYCDEKTSCSGATVCTASLPDAGTAHFCTKLGCKADAECGAGAFCWHGDPRGAACIVESCVTNGEGGGR